QATLRAVDADQIFEIEQLRPLDRPQASAATARVPAEGDGALEERRRWIRAGARLERALGETEHPLESIEDPVPAPQGLYAATHGGPALGGHGRRSARPERGALRTLRPRHRAAQR